MSKLLYITANPKELNSSHGLSVGREFIDAYKENNKEDEVIEVDLYKTIVPHIDEDVFNAWDKLASGVDFKNLSEVEASKLTAINNNLSQFMDADKYVFVTPLWNFGVPPVLKAYIDNLCILGKTFEYTEKGPVGLLKDKKSIVIQSSGGIYGSDAMSALEHGKSYLNVVLGFIGVAERQEILIEGVNMVADGGMAIRNEKVKLAKELATDF